MAAYAGPMISWHTLDRELRKSIPNYCQNSNYSALAVVLYSAARKTGVVRFYVVRLLTVLLLFTWNIIASERSPQFFFPSSMVAAVALFTIRNSSSCRKNEIRAGTIHWAHNGHIQLSHCFGFVREFRSETSLAEIGCIQIKKCFFFFFIYSFEWRFSFRGIPNFDSFSSRFWQRRRIYNFIVCAELRRDVCARSPQWLHCWHLF